MRLVAAGLVALGVIMLTCQNAWAVTIHNLTIDQIWIGSPTYIRVIVKSGDSPAAIPTSCTFYSRMYYRFRPD